MATWETKINEKLLENEESWEDVVSCTLTSDELAEDFYDDYGGPEGRPFTLWTKKRVYFPTEYDGAEGVASVARNPDGIPTWHI